MVYSFNADDILRIAEQIEINGFKFYLKAADLTEDKETKQVLTDLAKMENEHQQTFATMRAHLKAKEKKQGTFDPLDEATAYLQAFANGHVFDTKTDATELLTGKETSEEILKMAIGREKDAIVFFLGIGQVVPKELGQKRVDKIIGEEMSHITMLSNRLAILEKGKT